MWLGQLKLMLFIVLSLSVHAIKHERYVLIFDVAETIVSIHMSKCIKTRFKKGDKYPFVCIIE